MSGRRLVVEADGGSRGNPGPAGWGALVRDADGPVLARAGERCGRTTNNVAEYSGLVAGLRMAAAIDRTASVEVRMDSKLVVEQMSGRWKIKDRRLAGIAADASRAFDPARVRYTWVPRAQNAAADRLANDAMDGRERRVADVVASLGGAGPDDASHDQDDDPGPARSTAEVAERTAAPVAVQVPDPVSATTVLLVRHGRTRLTQERRFSGAAGDDAGLTEEGRADAVGATVFLEGVGVDAVVVSPLRRARQTADLLGSALAWPAPQVEEGWAEVAFGAWDGLTAAEVQQRDPELFARWLTGTDVAPPGGESMRALEARVAASFDDLVRRHQGGTVVVVCHMTPIRSVVRRVLGAGEQALWRLRCAPGSLTTVRSWDDGGAEVDGVGLHVPAGAAPTLF
ncbi:bifunctional RNase H/acid phosphatase [Aquipuribacter nitratireducens]|uniref:Bifunctional RNase H/acid phosphatase n=1 Tax=Aquipuribacter nitratireducens TaxID=650104 RepID=A0ABW0GKB8_9MICO